MTGYQSGFGNGFETEALPGALIYGVYDAKPDDFVPGGISLHNAMMPHGPDAAAFDAASTEPMRPVKQQGTLAFMFETRLRVAALETGLPASAAGHATSLDVVDGIARSFPGLAAFVEIGTGQDQDQALDLLAGRGLMAKVA